MNHPRAISILLFLCIAAQAALTFSYAITLHYGLKTSGFDGMVYEQLLHNVLNGRGLTTTILPPFTPQSWLGFHFSPVLYCVAAIYYVFPHIETLLAIGSVCVALAAWPMYLTAKHVLGNSGQALLMALLYLINPFVVNGTLWDFHEVDFAPLCIAWMLWAVVMHKRGLLVALSVALICIKEHYGLSVAGFGLLWAWQWRERRFGFGMAAFGVAALLVIVFAVMPYFNPVGKAAMMDAHSSVDRFSWLGSVAGIKVHAMSTLADGFWYGLALVLPLLLLPLGAFMWLMPAIADAAANILSQEAMMRSLISYHSIALMPVVLIAGCQAIRMWCAKRGNDILLAVVTASVCFSYMQLALPVSDMGNVWEFSGPQFGYQDNERKAVDAINAMIPNDAAVAAQINVLPHIGVRYHMYPYPVEVSDAKYVVLNLRFPFKRALSVFGIPFGGNNDMYFSRVDSLLQDEDWGVVYYSDRWVVLQKNGADNPQAHRDAVRALVDLRKEYGEVWETIRESYQKPH